MDDLKFLRLFINKLCKKDNISDIGAFRRTNKKRKWEKNKEINAISEVLRKSLQRLIK